MTIYLVSKSQFTPERHLPPPPGEDGHSHQRHTAATTTDKGNTVTQRASPNLNGLCSP